MSGGTDGAASYDDLLAEVAALQAENDRLRGLLGLDERSGDGHVQAWAPTLLTEHTDRPSVDSSSTAADKLALFWSLFGARAHVYAQRWQSASSGRSGWSPATKDRWAKGRPPRSYLPLTDDVFISHLRGETTIGIYPLLRNDTCALLACDFDKGTWALDALAYLDACHRNAVDAVCGALLGERAAGEAHQQALDLLRTAGSEGVAVEKELRRLLPLKTKAEYEPDDVAIGVATKAVDRALRCVEIAQAVAGNTR